MVQAAEDDGARRRGSQGDGTVVGGEPGVALEERGDASHGWTSESMLAASTLLGSRNSGDLRAPQGEEPHRLVVRQDAQPGPDAVPRLAARVADQPDRHVLVPHG